MFLVGMLQMAYKYVILPLPIVLMIDPELILLQ